MDTHTSKTLQFSFIGFLEYNRVSVRVRLWTQGITRNKEQVEKSARMSEEAALELGAEIVANTVTFAIGIIAIVMQQSIVSATEKKKEKEQEIEARKIEEGVFELERKVFDLGLTLEQIDARLRELDRKVLSLPGYGKITSLKKVDQPKSPS